MTWSNANHTLGRLFIVDDEAGLLNTLCEMVAGQGYEATGFVSAPEALEALREQNVDILLTDLMMPEMDGIALIRAALEIDKNLIAIIMTGFATVQSAIEAMKIGAFDYLMKPFKLTALLPLLSRAMEMRNLRLENIQLRETLAIHELGNAIAYSTDLKPILNKVVDAALQQCNADEASIMLPTDDGRELYVAAIRGAHAEHIGSRVPVEAGIAGWVARSQKTVMLSGEVDDPRFIPINPRSDIRASISMPMLVGGKLVGILNINMTRNNRPFTLGQLKVLNILVSIVAPVLENTQLYIHIRQAEEKYRSIFENAIEGIYQISSEGRLTVASPALARILGYESPEDLLRCVTDARQIYVDPKRHTELMDALGKGGEIWHTEFQVYRKDGGIIWIFESAHAIHDRMKNVLHYEGFIEDITQRKQVEEWFYRERSMVDRIMKTSPAGITIVNPEGRIVFANTRAEEIFGLPADEITQLSHDAPLWHITDFDGTLLPHEQLPFMQVMSLGRPVYGIRHAIESAHGRQTFISINGAPLFGESGEISGVVFTIDDITERKHAEDLLRESDERFRALFDRSLDCVYVHDFEGMLIDANSAALNLLGYGREDISSLNISSLIIPDQIPLYMETIEEVKENGFQKELCEYMWRCKDGRNVDLETRGDIIYRGARPYGIIGIARDITDRRRAEKALRRAEEKYRSIVENAQEGIFQTTPAGRLVTANAALVAMLGYASEEELFTAFTDITRLLYVNPEDHEKLIKWITEEGSVRQYEMQFYRKDGSRIWVASNIRGVLDSEGKLQCLEGFLTDITSRKHAEAKSEKSLEKLRQALAGTIQAMALTVEARDPYTAGHQKRVSELAKSIATEMGLSNDQIEGILMAGIVHDLGKILIPAEILSKPSQLSRIEFRLIKSHSQSGYDILKDIEFPWPVAQIVLQHHERLDGSGYPNGLSDGEILIEAKILAVADVVEAMASHRPYRPGLGIDQALEEISKNKGILYDLEAVDVCLDLFYNKKFALN